MNKSFSRSLIIVALLLLSCSFFVSCDRQEFPLARAKEPTNAPEYTYNPDINKSGAEVPK